MHIGTKTRLLAAATVVAALAASPAEAAFTMTVSETDGSTTNSGDGVALAPGSLAFVGLLGGSMLDVSTAVDIVTPTDVYFDLNTLAAVLVSPSAPLTLTVTVTQTDATLSTAVSPTWVNLALATDGAVAPGENIRLTAALDTSDLGRTSGSGVSTLSYGSGPGIFSTLGSSPSALVSLAGAPQTQPFSLSLTETIQFTSPGIVQVNSSVDPSVPEPSTLALLASGLPLLGFGFLRRRRPTGVASG
ncbi:MAG TPA: PEP-CTERM sorting domain-containing protein [Pirellulales bacterium]|nr:PEP-CTERM sorting domain-containing protein [Pirellulales bacterium]